MEAIRKMEPAWEKVCKSNFRLTSRTIIQPVLFTFVSKKMSVYFRYFLSAYYRDSRKNEERKRKKK